ncbi:MAG: glycosyltransferase family A protein [Ardenticatenales bacterium]
MATPRKRPVAAPAPALPGLTVITPTQGRETLTRLLDSVAANGLGDNPADEHLVVIDAHGMADHEAARIESTVGAYGPRWRAIRHDAGGHTWGHCEGNVGIEAARAGNYLTFNDDDDIYAPGAFAAIRRAITDDAAAGAPRVQIFRFMPPWRSPLPEGRHVERGRIGGHCLVVPNVDGKVGRLGHQYDGDYDLIESTIALWGGVDAAVFHDDIIAVARPD